MRNLIQIIMMMCFACYIPVSFSGPSLSTNSIQLCEAQDNQMQNNSLISGMISKVAAWRQCEDSTACGDGHHCCEISGGESRCYKNETPCP